MMASFQLKPFIAASLGALIVCGAVLPALAEDEPQGEPAGQEAQADKGDVYSVPDGTPEELLDFTTKLLSTPPDDASQDGRAAHLNKAIDASIEATTKVLASEEATPEQAARAAEIKLQMLTVAVQTGQEDAQQLETFKNEIREDKRQAVRTVIIQRDLLEQVGRWRQLDEGAQQQWMNDVVEYLASVELERQHGQLVAYAVRMLGQQEDKEAATKLVSLVKPVFENSDDEQVAAMAERLEGAVRYMDLEGSEMEIEGRLLSGEPFDWSQYDGKVVLVDFWATWCGPCIRELPNVVENYQKYHDKGFEVIGISLDEDAQKVREFVEGRDIPWPTLFSDDPQATAWNHPMAVKYGIQAIPAAILVDQQGKVVTKSARGEALGRHLQELLGDPLPSDGEEGRADETNDATGG